MDRTISLAALTVLELSQLDRARCAARAGYSHVGLRLLPATPQEAHEDLVHDRAHRRALARCLADHGLKVLDAEIFRLYPDSDLAGAEPAIEAAAELGATELLVAAHDPDEARLTAHFGAFCDLAARHGLNASLEFMPWTEARDLAQAARIVQGCARANAGVLVDAFHLSRSRSPLSAVAELPPGRLRYLQLCDAPAALPPTMDAVIAEARGERLFPGDGGLPLRALLRAVPPDLPLSIEVPTATLARQVGAEERARRALAATRRLLQDLA